MYLRSIVQCLCAAMLVFAVGGDVLAGVESMPAKTGAFQITFLEPSPASDPVEMGKRFKLKYQFRKNRIYSIKNELFEVFVPTTYRPWMPYGLIVWMDATDSGKIPEHWQKTLTKYRLIAIGAVKAGKKHEPLYRRMPLALDAVHNMRKLYKIDQERIYLAGQGEAGICASQLAVPYSETFTGGLFMGGVTFWKDTPGNDTKLFKVGMVPRARQISVARKSGRYVIVAGMKDPNRLKIESIYDKGFRKTFGKRSHFLDVPELPETGLKAEWLEESLQLLDQELLKGAATHSWKAANFESLDNKSEAMVRYFLAGVRGDSASEKKWMALDKEVQDQTKKLKTFIIAKKWHDAYQLASTLVKDYSPEIADNAYRIKVRMEAKTIVMNEVNGSGILKKVKVGLDDKLEKEKAIAMLTELLKKYPNTAAAKEATPLLATMTHGRTAAVSE